MSPYCYRCPFNRAKPERADAREYRKCHWECVGKVEQKFAARKKQGDPYAAFVFEPLMQGAAGMIPQPAGWLGRVAEIARGHGAQLIADEVMTAFGRATVSAPSLLACHQENVHPDFAALAKGLTGGYLPMAATLTTREVFAAFLGRYDEFKTFFHGHSFTGNQLGAAAALASLEILESPASLAARQRLAKTMREELSSLWPLPRVGDIRQVGLVAGVELGQELEDPRTVSLARTGRHPRLRRHGPARRADPSRRQRHRPHAPLLHHQDPGAKNNPRPPRVNYRNVRLMHRRTTMTR